MRWWWEADRTVSRRRSRSRSHDVCAVRDTILARSVLSPADLERHDPNCIGGHIIGGVQDARQLFTRPVSWWAPYSTPDPAIFLCSASTPPGAGVHGMCGAHAANAALKRRFDL